MRRCPSCQTAYDDEVGFCPEDGGALPPPEDELVGTTVSAWKLLERLGGGAMGSVYLGQHPSIRSKVAIKFLHRRYSKDKIAVGRFQNEARAANVIGHDNIVKVHDLGETPDGLHYLVMELLEGETLDVFLDRRGPLPIAETAYIAIQCCSGLHAAHEKGIVHRDVKPENIFLTKFEGRDNFVKLLDFGVAKLDESHGSTVRTRAGSTLGTPWYMSPEQAIGEPVDRRSDVYSLGVILYEMATGEVPFPEKDVTASMVAHVQHEPPPPRSKNKDVSPELEAVILKALEKNRNDRQQTMKELRDDLQRCLRSLAPVPVPAPPPKAKRTISGDRTVEVAGVSGPRPANRSQAEAFPTVFLPAAPGRPTWLIGGVIALASVAACAVLAAVLLRGRHRPVARIVVEPPTSSLPRRQGQPEAQPTMTVRSDPAGAQVRAVWPSGSLTGVTPFTFVAPRGSSVHLAFTLDGHDPGALEVVLDQPKLAEVQLHKRPAQAKKPAEARRRRAPGGEVKQSKEDELVPIGKDGDAFGDDSFGPQ